MIQPNMGTMLVYIFLECEISKKYMSRLLKNNLDNTFNSITVDSDTSTSDTLMMFSVGNKKINLNKKNIFFLKDIDGYDLFDAVKKSSRIISPEGIITHMGYYLKKPILALMHFNLYNRQDFISQIISCKEWFPPTNYNFIVLKKNFDKSLQKILKRI